MSELITSGAWKPKPGEDDAFIAAWGEFAAWASGMAGAGTLRLMRDLADPSQFLSTGLWDSIEQVHAWEGLTRFPGADGPRLAARCRVQAGRTPGDRQRGGGRDDGRLT